MYQYLPYDPLSLSCYLSYGQHVRITFNGKNYSLPQNLLKIIQDFKGSLCENYFEIKLAQYQQCINLIKSIAINIQEFPQVYLELENSNRIKWIRKITNNMDDQEEELTFSINDEIFKDVEINKNLFVKCQKLHGSLLISGKNRDILQKNVLTLSKQYKRSKPILIVCAPEEIENWKKQIVKFFGFEENKVVSLQTTDKSDQLLSDVYIITFNQFSNRNQSSKSCQTLQQTNFSICIVDKWSKIKDYDQDFRRNYWRLLFRNCRHIFLLQKNSLTELPKLLFPAFSIIRPDIFSNFYDFQTRYDPIRLNQTQQLNELNYLINEYIMFQIPENNSEQKAIFRRFKRKIECDFLAQEKVNLYWKQQLQKVMFKQCDPIEATQIYSKELNPLQNEISKGKRCEIKKYIEQLQSAQKKAKIIVFASMNNLLDELFKDFEEQSVKLYGVGKKKEIILNSQKFSENESIVIAFINSKLQKRQEIKIPACHIVFAELPMSQNQILKLEQKVIPQQKNKEIFCHFLIGANTIDEDIVNHLEQKYQHMQMAFKGVQERLILTDQETEELQQKLQNQPIQFEETNIQEKQDFQQNTNRQVCIQQNKNDQKNKESLCSKKKKNTQKLAQVAQQIQQSQEHEQINISSNQIPSTSNLEKISSIIIKMEECQKQLELGSLWDHLILLQKLQYEEQKRINQLLENLYSSQNQKQQNK